MNTLNLINSENSDIDYVVSRFPDGEVKITLGEINRKEPLDVVCRVRNAEELFILTQVADILDRHCVVWTLHIYYLMSMRMDRVMTFNDPYNLKIVSSIINTFKANKISVYHPHSNKTALLIDNFITFFNDEHPNCNDFRQEDYQVCFPDEGAYERYSEHYNFVNNPLICKKERDVNTGKILGIKVVNPEDYLHKKIMVVDDLCDAGGTFIGVAKAIRSIDENANISISVIHMVNRKGIENLSSAYNEVFFTNTYNDWQKIPSNCKIFDVIK